MAGVTILVRDGICERTRKITKIIPLNDGGFSVVAPYHSARRGFLFKLESSTAPGRRTLRRKDNLEEFSAGDLVKLSVHADGFTQFSSVNGNNIRSGRNEDGSPKGLALLTDPITIVNPNQPVFSLTVWGLREFEETVEPATPECSLFTQNQIFTQPVKEHRAGAYIVEGLLMPPAFRSQIVHRAGGSWLPHALLNYIPRPGKIAQLGVVDFGHPSYFIALLVTRKKHGFPSDSGFMLASPGQAVGRDGEYAIVRCIYATYPEIDWSPSGPQPMRTLDYAPRKV